MLTDKSHFVLFDCSEVNSTWLITSELANQRAQKVLFTCVVYTNIINMLDLLLMPQVKLPLVDRIYPQSNRFVVDVETKPVVTQNLMTAPNRTLSCNKRFCPSYL